jgi:hypothetical protein
MDELILIINEVSYRLFKDIKSANEKGELKEYLNKIGMGDLFPDEEKESFYDTDPDGKILIFGDSKIKDRIIYGCLKEYGIDKERIELHLGYEEAKKYDFRKLQYNSLYRLILFGPVPHSMTGKGDYSSIITFLENNDGYPKVVRLTDAHGLKITKTSLKKAIEQEIESGYLAV